jgi:hypothetical protein
MHTDLHKINSSALLREKLLKYRGLIASSFYDPTEIGWERMKKSSFIEMDILQAINRNSEHQFQSMVEIKQHLNKSLQEKLLTD